ncbi:MAG: nuclear transport factor 2 family protein [Gemmatimonadales bacterium]|nr:nuclear transport factor 2 family protein [Gemmatimonadales bacterium]
MKPLHSLSLVLGLAGCGAGSSSPPPLDPAARAAIADTVRAVSEAMIVAMRTRDVDSVLAYYGPNTAYVGNGEIGDWPAILHGAPPRYATYTKVDCRWPEPFRVDVLSRNAAVVTAVLDCEKADTSGQAWREVVARTEVLAHEDGRWKIVAVHESMKPGSGELR